MYFQVNSPTVFVSFRVPQTLLSRFFWEKKNQHTVPQSIRQLVSKFPYYRQELRIWGLEGGGQGFPY